MRRSPGPLDIPPIALTQSDIQHDIQEAKSFLQSNFFSDFNTKNLFIKDITDECETLSNQHMEWFWSSAWYSATQHSSGADVFLNIRHLNRGFECCRSDTKNSSRFFWLENTARRYNLTHELESMYEEKWKRLSNPENTVSYDDLLELIAIEKVIKKHLPCKNDSVLFSLTCSFSQHKQLHTYLELNRKTLLKADLDVGNPYIVPLCVALNLLEIETLETCEEGTRKNKEDKEHVFFTIDLESPENCKNFSDILLPLLQDFSKRDLIQNDGDLFSVTYIAKDAPEDSDYLFHDIQDIKKFIVEDTSNELGQLIYLTLNFPKTILSELLEKLEEKLVLKFGPGEALAFSDKSEESSSNHKDNKRKRVPDSASLANTGLYATVASADDNDPTVIKRPRLGAND